MMLSENWFSTELTIRDPVLHPTHKGRVREVRAAKSINKSVYFESRRKDSDGCICFHHGLS